jgi:hypothetical protein
MIEAYKAGPYAMTPLRICWKSSMKRPQPSGVRLKDCLLKEPPALADLYTAILGIGEHKVAFMTDISKFYQCVEADETARLVRRICGGLATVFVTTRVNYGDRPAGYIAIATLLEIVERFNKVREEAAWFLKNRTYVDVLQGTCMTKE